MYKYLLLLIPFCANSNEYLDKTHVTIGIAHKIQENKYEDSNGVLVRQSPTARFEVFYQYNSNVKFGVSHHSQWTEGAPFNDRKEYAKTELFIDYTFSLGYIF